MVYHCDYCDRSFPYNKRNIKIHNSSKQHLAYKESYYKKFQDFKHSDLIINANDHLKNWLNNWPLYKAFNDLNEIPPSILINFCEEDKLSLEWG